MSTAQSLMASMPPLIPGGRLDPNSTVLATGVTKDLEAHHRRLKEDEERIRANLAISGAKARAALRQWEAFERESKALKLKSELSGQSLAKIAGEGTAGAAF